MDIDKLFDTCQTLETTIAILVRSNANKQAEAMRLQNNIFDESQASLNQILAKEKELQYKLDLLKSRKNDIETEIKQYSDINEKLSDLVAIVQKSNPSAKEDNECRNDEMCLTIIETLDEYEQIKQEYTKTSSKVTHLNESLDRDSNEVKNLISENQELVLDLHKNDTIIRLSDQQNKYAEQQFDVIINQLPWEPLTDQYIDELRKSSVLAIKQIADSLQLQKNEILDLTDSLNHKKAKKLGVLEELYSVLNTFLQKRDEAVLITRVMEA